FIDLAGAATVAAVTAPIVMPVEPAFAKRPEGTKPGPLTDWYEALQDIHGQGCCGENIDCRVVPAKYDEEKKHWWAFAKDGVFKPFHNYSGQSIDIEVPKDDLTILPDEEAGGVWIAIPNEIINKKSEPHPDGKAVLCLEVLQGAHTINRKIKCFVPPVLS